ncbi:MAG: hypothetical protein NT027_06320 [Proteobacteria bacterium]|nr:hypothetical protein [Pseudomonadota bacterium]
MSIWKKNSVPKVKKTMAGKSSQRMFETFDSDPFDLNEDDSFFDFGESKVVASQTHSKDGSQVSQHQVRSQNSNSWISRIHSLRQFRTMFLVVGSTGLLFFGLWIVKPWKMWSTPESVYAYFEVRAVDQSGRPVAGAVVKNAGKKVGSTDSFGEWRRYMRVPLGAVIPIALSKKTNSEILAATKNFAVPLFKPEKSDIELRASIQLLASGQKATSLADIPKENRAQEASTQTADKISGADSLVPAVSSESHNSAIADTVGNANSAQLTAQTKVESPLSNFVSSHESIWFEGTGSLGSPLNRAVIPALAQRAKELGLRIDPKAEWKVRLTGLVEKPTHLGKDGGGLLLVSSFDSPTKPAKEFLRNYFDDDRVTARGILFVLSKHVNKNLIALQSGSRWFGLLPSKSAQFWSLASAMSLQDAGGREWLTSTHRYESASLSGFLLTGEKGAEAPCISGISMCEISTRSFESVPPVPTWTRLKLKLSTMSKEAQKVFVAGYEAKQMASGAFEYWGQDKAKANVSIVESGRLILRTQINNDAKNSPVVAIPSGSISKR